MDTVYKKLPDDFSLICDLRSFSRLATSAELLRAIKNSICTNNYYIFKNNIGNPVGYAIWARVVKETLARLHRTGLFPQHFYEWNEGYITLLLDLYLVEGLTPNNRKQLFLLYSRHRILVYVRKAKIILKLSCRTLKKKLAE